MAEIARADNDQGPVLGEPELPGDLVHQVVDVIADTAGSVRAQVRQVLAQLGGVHPRRDGELLARDGGYAAFGQRIQGPEVDREAVDRCLRDTVLAVFRHDTARHPPALLGGSTRPRGLEGPACWLSRNGTPL